MRGLKYFPRAVLRPCAALVCLALSNCHAIGNPVDPSVEFTLVPAAGEGGPEKLERWN
jgi:hypothetical protein